MPPNRSALFIAGLDLPQIGTWRNKNGQIINTAQFGISIPEQYPYQQIGVGYNHPEHAIHIQAITLNNQHLRNVYSCNCRFGQTGWNWFCFQQMEWDHQNGDTLLTLLGIIEASFADRIPNNQNYSYTNNSYGGNPWPNISSFMNNITNRFKKLFR